LIPSAAVTLALPWMIVLWGRQPDRTRVPPATHQFLEQLVREDAYNGLLYSAQLLPEARGTRSTRDLSVDTQLKDLQTLFSQHPDDPDLAFWTVSGTLATLPPRLSGSYLEDALRNFPEDPRFENLAAILAFKRNDLTGAERYLRAAATRDTSGVAKLDLVRVLTALGRDPEAEKLANELRLEHPRLASEVTGRR
jgi:hypothetical protein